MMINAIVSDIDLVVIYDSCCTTSSKRLRRLIVIKNVGQRIVHMLNMSNSVQLWLYTVQFMLTMCLCLVGFKLTPLNSIADTNGHTGRTTVISKLPHMK